jgi:molecular chaperone DnaK
MLKEKDREEIKVDLENLKQTLPSNDPVKIKEALTRLEGSAYRIADAIYAQEAPKT